MDEPIEYIDEMIHRIKKWLQDDGGASFESWAKEERLFTDDKGLLWLREKSEAVPVTNFVQTSLLTNYLARIC
jgi:hypothetical protein